MAIIKKTNKKYWQGYRAEVGRSSLHILYWEYKLEQPLWK
jgi:hypothetical protein